MCVLTLFTHQPSHGHRSLGVTELIAVVAEENLPTPLAAGPFQMVSPEGGSVMSRDVSYMEAAIATRGRRPGGEHLDPLLFHERGGVLHIGRRFQTASRFRLSTHSRTSSWSNSLAPFKSRETSRSCISDKLSLAQYNVRRAPAVRKHPAGHPASRTFVLPIDVVSKRGLIWRLTRPDRRLA